MLKHFIVTGHYLMHRSNCVFKMTVPKKKKEKNNNFTTRKKNLIALSAKCT